MQERGSNANYSITPESRTPEQYERYHLVEPTEFEIRISYADALHDDPAPAQIGTLAKQVGTYENWIIRTAPEIGITPSKDPTTGENWYPPFSAAVLRDELLWRNTYKELPKFLTVTQISDHVGRHRHWTLRRLRLNQIEPDSRQVTQNKLDRYNKSALKTLREQVRSYPEDDGWLHLSALHELTGANRQWIQTRLYEEGVPAQLRYSRQSYQLAPHYPSNSLDIIQALLRSREKPGGNWLTAGAIEGLIDQTDMWLEPRLEAARGEAEMRLDDRATSRLHYPPHVVERIIRESKSHSEIPEAGDWLSVSAMAEILGRSNVWVSRRLATVEAQSEIRRYGNNNVARFYHPSTLDLLRPLLNVPIKREPKIVTESDLADARQVVASIKARLSATRAQLDTIVQLNHGETDQSKSLRIVYRRQIQELSRAATKLNKFNSQRHPSV